MGASGSTLAFAPETGMFVGRHSELVRLQEAMRKRESLLVWGAADAGKSTLVTHAISQMPERMVRSCIRGIGNGSPQDILRSIAHGFAEDPLFKSKFRADTGYGASFSHWVRQQSSLRLRGLLYRAAGQGEYWIFLEDLAPMTHMLTRIVKELMLNQETPVYAIARGWTYEELGHGSQLYWNDRQRLAVGGLPLAAAKELVEWCIRRFGLVQFDLEGFREDILQFSGMLPGAILRMCAAASDSRYQFEGRIKTKLLHVDYLMKHCHGNGQLGLPSGRVMPEIR